MQQDIYGFLLCHGQGIGALSGCDPSRITYACMSLSPLSEPGVLSLSISNIGIRGICRSDCALNPGES